MQIKSLEHICLYFLQRQRRPQALRDNNFSQNTPHTLLGITAKYKFVSVLIISKVGAGE